MKRLINREPEWELVMDLAHGVAVPWPSQGRSVPFASGRAASLSMSVAPSRTEQGPHHSPA